MHVRTAALRLRFRLEGTYGAVRTNGRYVLLSVLNPGPFVAAGSLLIDTSSGHRRAVRGCDGALGLGDAPWLWSFPCQTGGGLEPSVQLDDLKTGGTSSVPINACIVSVSAVSSCDVVVGAVWAAVTQSCYHCATSPVLENLATQRIRPLPRLAPNEVLDLSVPSARRRLCWPLRHTAKLQPSTDWNGSLSFGAPTGRLAIVTSETNTEYLQRCGSHKLTALNGLVLAANSHAIVFANSTESQPLVLHGMLIPSRRPFTVRLPAQVPRPGPRQPARTGQPRCAERD